ncbi:MAG: hypothetical protein UU81_C0052G0003 [Microgenomates group bacterium GW2011_GWC1_41_8]|uniref:Uncharacterized protein n=2 Tax=Candidatus Roizmaniibacteriota TaxID=1752723 RepID=A0A0G0WCB6_9BACT|nr:MAG: hypothetical protein UU14_C0001G0029 [Candidatus Roizmanbacteria bacterium GW2011_GWB1_40_7]KKR94916.1 MAG: hypothetical protein UU41_C0002G0037 [Candidatus Roizmanbacteria bacterium GW2011_GWA1_41_13]KKS22544.1 MAG: hypothetical protein UU81_C0052G0003 [Microgenomates group bacterium GW2011_GWC1_41_8]
MKTALIGYTGFVGSNLADQTTFTDYYNSKNINKIQGKRYDYIVSAGVHGERWRANKYPQEDWQNIQKLLNNLANVETDHFILISSIDVYPTPEGTEDTVITLSDFTQSYGRHRFRMEQFIKTHFSKTTFIRLPQLYGPGLKKNFVYDLIHDRMFDFTHKDTMHQWYNLANLWKDIQLTLRHQIPIINLAVEPISAKELARVTRNISFTTITDQPPLLFDVKTKYAKLYGSHDSYIYHKKETLKELKIFINNERKKIDKKKKEKILILIPAYNVAPILEKTIREIPKNYGGDILVVDDGSTDGTRALCKKLKLPVISHKKNRGYGGAQKTGYQEAIKKKYDFVVLVHGDDQYDPSLIPLFIQTWKKGNYDLITGSRMIVGDVLRNGMPFWKFTANRFLTLLENAAFQTNLTDFHDGYRAYSTKFLKDVPLDLLSDYYDFDSDLVIQAIIRGYRIAEISHPTRYRDENQQMSFIKGIPYGVNILVKIINYLLHRSGIRRQAVYTIK